MNENVNESNEARTIDLNAWLMSYLNKWWLILACVLVGITIAFIYTANFVTPLYRSSVSMYVNNVRSNAQIDTISSANLSASQTLVNTYLQIINSNTMIERVIAKNGWEERASVGRLKSMISASQVNETGIFILNASSPYPEVAQEIAEAMADTIVDTMGEIVEGSSVKIIDHAQLPTSPYSPNYAKNMLFGGVMAGGIVVAVLTLFFFMDTKIRSSEELERMFKLPVLGHIPDFDNTIERHAYSLRHNGGKKDNTEG